MLVLMLFSVGSTVGFGVVGSAVGVMCFTVHKGYV
jgi:hypothetical protein